MMPAHKSPQLEDGHIRIANELFDAIVNFSFTAHQLKVVLAILRKTYGYGKKEDDVSASQLGALCRLPRSHVATALTSLVAMGVISKSTGHYGSVVGINKNYSNWIDKKAMPVEPKVVSVRTLDAANSKAYHYVYQITDPASGRIYIGVRSCDCHPNQDRYVGSGNWIATLDKRSLRKDVLGIYPIRSQAEAAEIEAIKASGRNCANDRKYVRTESVPCTDSVRVHKLAFVGTDSVQVDSTESVHTKDNLPKDNKQQESASAASSVPSGFAKLALVPTPPPVIDLPIKDGSEFEVSESMVAEWSAAYPGIDIPAELAKARVWLRASPQNQKTRRGMGKFIVNWLSNAQTPRHFANKRPSAHGNFAKQDYRAGIGDDGSF